MNLEEQFILEHLLFKVRTCRVCGIEKELLTDFYRTRKNRKSLSAYSYECKECTKKRILEARKKDTHRWEYPDW